MKATRIAVGLTVALVTAGRVPGATTAGESNTWSVPTNGLQARLTLGSSDGTLHASKKILRGMPCSIRLVEATA